MPTLVLLDASLSMLRPVDCGRREYHELRKKMIHDEANINGTFDNTRLSNGLESTNEVSTKHFVNSGVQLMDLAKWGIDKLLLHFEQAYKLEQVAVLSYSSQCDLVAPFTRDISEVRGKVIPCGSKSI